MSCTDKMKSLKSRNALLKVGEWNSGNSEAPITQLSVSSWLSFASALLRYLWQRSVVSLMAVCLKKKHLPKGLAPP